LENFLVHYISKLDITIIPEVKKFQSLTPLNSPESKTIRRTWNCKYKAGKWSTTLFTSMRTWSGIWITSHNFENSNWSSYQTGPNMEKVWASDLKFQFLQSLAYNWEQAYDTTRKDLCIWNGPRGWCDNKIVIQLSFF